MTDPRREQQLRIQALGAALSLRDWHATEQAYNAIRDHFDRPSKSTQNDALVEAERFMSYFANETDGVFVGPGTPTGCLAKIREAIAHGTEQPRSPVHTPADTAVAKSESGETGK
jgi:hypothetical protein